MHLVNRKRWTIFSDWLSSAKLDCKTGFFLQGKRTFILLHWKTTFVTWKRSSSRQKTNFDSK